MKAVIKTINLNKVFYIGGTPINALQEVSLEVNPRDFAIVFGPSGCGKSTLLHSIIGLEPPESGKVYIRGVDLYALSEDERAEFRARSIGMVYQQPLWIRSLTVLENIILPALAIGVEPNEARARAREILVELKIDKLLYHLPTETSIGEQQRIGIARSLINDPWLLILDEPTGNLDTKTAYQLFQLLKDINEKRGRTILLVTHNPVFLVFATRRINLIDGQIAQIQTGLLTKTEEEHLKTIAV